VDWSGVVPRGSEGHTGVVRVEPFGKSIDLTALDKNTWTIVDAAASLGSRPLQLESLHEKHAIVFSMHATKVLGCGEGGFAVFGDAKLADLFRSWTSFGFVGDRNARVDGTNAKMPEIAAAYGHASLDQWNQEFAEWKAVNERAREITFAADLEIFPSSSEGVTPYWIVDFGSQLVRDQVEKNMQIADVQTRRWWESGCHRMPAFSNSSTDLFPNTDRIAGSTLGLPMFRDLATDQFERIAAHLVT